MNEIQLSTGYVPNRYWYKDAENYLLDTNEFASQRKYYDIPTQEIENKLFYVPNFYWVGIEQKEGATMPSKVQKAQEESMKENTTYYYLKGNYTITNVVDPTTGEVYQVPNGGELVQVNGLEELGNNAYYFKEGNNYKRVLKSDLPIPAEGKEPTTTAYYKITTVEQQTFYTSNTYYYTTTDNKNDYIKDVDTIYVPSRTYYTQANVEEVSSFYMPDTFYYIDGENYILDEALTMTEGREYYQLDKYYVFEDPSGEFAVGAE
jgi:hypothetical protein